MRFLDLKKKGFGPLSRALFFALALLPLVLLIVNVIRFCVDVPFWDQWNFVPLLGKSFEGEISFLDLWALHNEHRLFFPRLIMLGFAHLSGYDISWELALTIVLAAAIFVLVLRRARKVFSLLGLQGFWIAPALSLLAFSLHQGENWVWGWQIQVFLNVLAVAAGLLFLTSPGFNWGKFFGGAVCGVVATYSFANGLAYWPLALLGLAGGAYSGLRKKKKALTAWVSLTALVYVSYFFRFRPGSPSGEPMHYFATHPLEYVQYILKYLGAAIITYQKYALYFGLLCLILFGWTVRSFLRRYRNALTAMSPLLLMGTYSLACAALTGIGRVGFGAMQATSYRYVTFSNLIWFAILVFLAVQLGDVGTAAKSKRAARVKRIALGAIIIITLVLVGRTSYRVGYRMLKSYHGRLLPARTELLRGENDELLRRLYIDPGYVREGREVLKKHSLSVFRSTTPPQ